MVISYYSGYIVLGTALLMIIPILTSLVFKEWNPLFDFAITMVISTLIGMSLVLFGQRIRENKAALQWKHGFVVVSFSWILLMVLCSIPYRLSGHTLSFLDACFDVMSGFTTTGLALTQDLDHISVSLNMWRHMLTFIGGQGVVVLALTFLVKQVGGAYKFYVGEGKDIELAPNVKGTTRLIWKISMIYLIFGTIVLWINGMLIGLNPVSAFFHGLFMFVSSWSTGGFSPMSQNIMYYHSFSFEVITIVFFILGSLNFGLHYAIWQGKKKELLKNIEVQSFVITSFLACTFAAIGLSKTGIYSNAISAFRRVVYNVLSAHTTTGLGSIYARQFAKEWGGFGILIMIVAMLIGGSACSTAGGFKGLRVGIVIKGIVADVKRLLSPERNVKAYKFHHIKDHVLDDRIIKTSSVIIICYMITFTIGTAIAAYYGYPLLDAAFEAASVTGNVGFSIGITSPSMPSLLKIYYIIAMFLGRLEFLSVFALIGYFIGGIKKLWERNQKY
jgi:trk system potassium uptake protein TrkH